MAKLTSATTSMTGSAWRMRETMKASMARA
jgi:hypothetical protein